MIAYGTFEEISNEETRENVLSKLYSRLPHMTPVESKLVEGLKETIVFRVKVDEITGVGEECEATVNQPWLALDAAAYGVLKRVAHCMSTK